MREALIAVALLLVGPGSGLAGEPVVPSWMKVDGGAKKVAMDVIAGFNPNNSSWNFNGYYEGDMTVVVPEDWRVEIAFTNQDGDVPHSLVVMADPGADNLPLQAGREQAAFARAYSRSPEQGLSAGNQDTISFKTNKQPVTSCGSAASLAMAKAACGSASRSRTIPALPTSSSRRTPSRVAPDLGQRGPRPLLSRTTGGVTQRCRFSSRPAARSAVADPGSPRTPSAPGPRARRSPSVGSEAMISAR